MRRGSRRGQEWVVGEELTDVVGGIVLTILRFDADDARIPAAGGDRDYAVNVFAARAQLDF